MAALDVTPALGTSNVLWLSYMTFSTPHTADCGKLERVGGVMRRQECGDDHVEVEQEAALTSCHLTPAPLQQICVKRFQQTEAERF